MRTLYDCHVWRNKLERSRVNRVEFILTEIIGMIEGEG